jgi:hypothetical protein
MGLSVNIGKKIFFLALLILTAAYCENNEQTRECIDNPLNFISLTTESDTIESGMSTLVTAIAEGYKLSYQWEADRGYITPQTAPNVVKYLASPCAAGEITITCKVTDDCNNSLSKDVKIVVL